MIFVVPWPLLLLGEPSTPSLLMFFLYFYESTLLNPMMRYLPNSESSNTLLKLNVSKRSCVFGLMGEENTLVMPFITFFARSLFSLVIPW
jgi:hypothetical protein